MTNEQMKSCDKQSEFIKPAVSNHMFRYKYTIENVVSLAQNIDSAQNMDNV